MELGDAVLGRLTSALDMTRMEVYFLFSLLVGYPLGYVHRRFTHSATQRHVMSLAVGLAFGASAPHPDLLSLSLSLFHLSLFLSTIC